MATTGTKTATTTGTEPRTRAVNVAVVRGTLTSEVRISELASGSVVHNFELRTGSGAEGRVVPVAWHDPVRPPRLDVGAELVVVGVIRRRWFRAGGGSQSRTELVADSVGKAGSKRVANAVQQAVENLAENGVLPC